MGDDWKRELRKLKKKVSDKKGGRAKRGNEKPAKAGTEAVDPEALWGKRDEIVPEGSDGAISRSAPLPPPPESGTGDVPFNLGIDIGTSTTKICVRPPERRAGVMVLELENEPGGLCPSTVTLAGGRLYFGSEGEGHAGADGARVFRHLKVCVACEAERDRQGAMSGCRSRRDRKTGRCTGIFDLGNSGDPCLRASGLLTLFLAWVMGESRRQIPDDLTGGKVPRTTYSVAAPVDQIDAGSPLNEAYARIAFYGWRLSGAVYQGVDLATAVSWIRALPTEEMPASEERLVELCAESAATVAGYAMSPEIEEGLYALVDIGAWTTEVSFFRFTEVNRRETGRATRAFYAARSHRVAAGLIDERCLENLRRLYEDVGSDGDDPVAWIRVQREAGTFGTVEHDFRTKHRAAAPRSSALAFARDLVAEELGRCFIRTQHEAFEKEKRESLWKGSLRVLVSGGGSNEAVLRDGIRSTFIKERQVVPVPADIQLPGEDTDYRRFLVAYGLAQSSARWPDDLFPDKVLPVTFGRRKRPTPEDLGYDKR